MDEMLMVNNPSEVAESGYARAMKKQLAGLEEQNRNYLETISGLKNTVASLESDKLALSQKCDKLNKELTEVKGSEPVVSDLREQMNSMIDSFSELRQTVTESLSGVTSGYLQTNTDTEGGDLANLSRICRELIEESKKLLKLKKDVDTEKSRQENLSASLKATRTFAILEAIALIVLSFIAFS